VFSLSASPDATSGIGTVLRSPEAAKRVARPLALRGTARGTLRGGTWGGRGARRQSPVPVRPIAMITRHAPPVTPLEHELLLAHAQEPRSCPDARGRGAVAAVSRGKRRQMGRIDVGHREELIQQGVDLGDGQDRLAARVQALAVHGSAADRSDQHIESGACRGHRLQTTRGCDEARMVIRDRGQGPSERSGLQGGA
jgi:hypothetical protein